MSDEKQGTSAEINIGKMIQKACIQAAREGFRDASMRGLCAEGAIEAAIGAIQSLDIEKIVVNAGYTD